MAPGSFHAILGPSGCGKSTLLKALAGLIPASGDVSLPGDGRFAYVPQGNSCFPWLRAEENVAYGMKLRGLGRRNAWLTPAPFSATSAHALRRHYPAQLSEGMRQRVAIARAFAIEAPLLLMDEPLSALDFQTKVAVQDELLRLWTRRRCTVLYVTHDIDEALALADNVSVLSGRPGRVIETITVPFERPRGYAAVRAHPGYAETFARSTSSWSRRERARGVRASLLGVLLPVALVSLWQWASTHDWIDPLFYPAPGDVLQRTWEQFRHGSSSAIRASPPTGCSSASSSAARPASPRASSPAGRAPSASSSIRSRPRSTWSRASPCCRSCSSPSPSAKRRASSWSRSASSSSSTSARLSGVEQVERTHLDTARAFGAGRLRLAWTVLLPGAAPAIFSGLRVALGFALIVIVGTEFLAANDGLGARIWLSYQIFDFPSMYAGIVAVTVLGLVLAGVLLVIERAAIPWRR